MTKQLGFYLLFAFWAVFLLMIVQLNRTPENFEIEFEIDVIDSSSVKQPKGELYYDTGRGFNENQTIKFFYRMNDTGKPQRYKLPLPVRNIVKLRFDPLPDKGTIAINSLSFLGECPVCLDIAKLKNDLKPIHSIESIRLENNTLTIASNGPDPHLLLLDSPSLGTVFCFFYRIMDLPADKLISGLLALILMSAILTYYTVFASRKT